MKIVLDPIEEEDIERIVKALDNQQAYLRSRDREDSAYKRLADLFRQFLKRGQDRPNILDVGVIRIHLYRRLFRAIVFAIENCVIRA